MAADGVVSPLDIAALKTRIIGNFVSYTGVIQPNGDNQLMMGDPAGISPLDLPIIKSMSNQNTTAANPTIPTDLVVDGDTMVNVEVGMTARVTIGVTNYSTNGYTSSIGVTFEIDPASTGAATILGGEGESDTGRYDVSGPRLTGGQSSIVPRVDTAGTVYLNAKTLACGDPAGKGRYCTAIDKTPAATIIGY